MTTAPLFSSTPTQGLRPLDLGRDLAGIADLMNLCFGARFDSQDRHAVREMEWLSRSGPLLWFLGALPNFWQMGFVWIENNKVVGNISTQPSEGDAATWLIANVAVHPDYRGRGIARALTAAALNLAAERGATRVMLQVHHDNPTARHIYEASGFKVVATHTHWERTSGFVPPLLEVAGVEVRLAPRDKWQTSYEFVRRFRPTGFSWVRPLTPHDWRPNWFRSLEQFLSAQRSEVWWAIEKETNTLIGLFTVNAGFHNYDELNVVFYPPAQKRLERLLLTTAVRRLQDRAWTIYLDHPAEESADALRELNFRQGQTLVWMQLEL